MGWFGNALKTINPVAIAGMAVDALTQHSANKTNKKIAREQMAFQERMSSTEMQRRVHDLKMAGLNPMLAGMNQQGASSAQGATTRVEPITRNTASTALAMATQRAQLENLDAQTRLLVEQQRNVKETTNMLPATAARIGAETTKLEHEFQNLAQDFKRKQAEIDISEEQLKRERLTNKQLEQLQPLLLEYQRLVNQAEQLGMTQRQIDQKFAEQLGQESKWLRFIRDIVGASNPRSN